MLSTNKMKINSAVFLTALSFTFYFEESHEQKTVWDEYLPLYRFLRDISLRILTPPSGNVGNLRQAKYKNKIQPQLKTDVAFPCPLNNSRSTKRPNSVHELRPGDIDVVGAIGDSLTAGNGLVATNLQQVAIDSRGLAFNAGGQGTWRSFLTVPNILKEFNPNLTGFSTADSFGHHKEAEFNAAEPGANSRDTPYMTRILINRMRNNPKVNIIEHWKLISVFIGANDICGNMCYMKNPEIIVEDYKKYLSEAMRLLRDNLPRTLVYIILIPNFHTLAESVTINRPLQCYIAQNLLCPCLFGLQFEHLHDKIDRIITKYQEVSVEIANSPEFDRDDFTIVTLPFLLDYKVPKTAQGLPDYSSFSEDCFHLSQKENAKAALSIWNNLLEPVGKKSTSVSELFYFKCPSEGHPFIFTKRNSAGL